MDYPDLFIFMLSSLFISIYNGCTINPLRRSDMSTVANRKREFNEVNPGSLIEVNGEELRVIAARIDEKGHRRLAVSLNDDVTIASVIMDPEGNRFIDKRVDVGNTHVKTHPLTFDEALEFLGFDVEELTVGQIVDVEWGNPGDVDYVGTQKSLILGSRPNGRIDNLCVIFDGIMGEATMIYGDWKCTRGFKIGEPLPGSDAPVTGDMAFKLLGW